MLVRISTLEPWRGEPVPRTTTEAELVRHDGTRTPVAVEPYQFEVNVPAEIEEKWTVEELAAHDLCKPEPFEVPPGKRRKGDRKFERRGKKVFEAFDVEDEPPPPAARTKAERLADLLGSFDLTKADLKELLADEAPAVEEPPTKTTKK